MSRPDWKLRVSVSPDIRHGSPCIKGTRVPLSVIVGGLAEGMSTDELLAEDPQLEVEDIGAALAYAAEVMEHELVLPVAS